MRTRLLCLTALSLAFMGLGPVYAQNGVVNLLTNGNLETGTLDGWGGYGDNTREVVTEIVGRRPTTSRLKKARSTRFRPASNATRANGRSISSRNWGRTPGRDMATSRSP